MKIVHTTNNENQELNEVKLLKKAIEHIENDEFEAAKFHLNEIIDNDMFYSDAYIFRFIANMYTKDFETAARDIVIGFNLEKKYKNLKSKHSMAEVVKEFWYYSTFEQRKGLRSALKNLSIKLKIVK